jgi:hypothetical protein
VALPFQAATAWWFISKYIDISVTDVLRACRKSALVTVVTVLPVVAILGAQGFASPVSLPLLLVSGLAAAGGWCLGVVMTKHPIRAQLESVVPPTPLRRVVSGLRRTRALIKVLIRSGGYGRCRAARNDWAPTDHRSIGDEQATRNPT